jgi:hypothetical protein
LSDELQTLVEGVVLSEKVTFLDDVYRIADKVGLMPMMKFAHASSSTQLDTGDMEGLAAIYEMLKDCIHPDDWARFERDAITKKAEADDLLPVVRQTVDMLTARGRQ